MPRNFSDKSFWNAAPGFGVNNVNVATLGEVNAMLALAGATIAYGSQDDLGKRFILSEAEASIYQYGSNAIYGAIYQPVYVDSGATAAEVAVGKVAFTKDTGTTAGTGAKTYAVTGQGGADAVDLIAGVFLNTITPGNYGIICVGGKVAVKYRNTPSGTPAVGDYVGVFSGGGGLVDSLGAVSANSGVAWGLVIGRSITAGSANSLTPVEMGFTAGCAFGRY